MTRTKTVAVILAVYIALHVLVGAVYLLNHIVLRAEGEVGVGASGAATATVE